MKKTMLLFVTIILCTSIAFAASEANTINWKGYSWKPVLVSYGGDSSHGNWHISNGNLKQNMVSALHYKIRADSMEDMSDYEVTAKLSFDSGTETAVCLRMDEEGNGYCAATGSWDDDMYVARLINGDQNPGIILTSGKGTLPVSTKKDYYIKIQALGNEIKGKAWLASDSEPDWMVQVTDNRFSEGKVGFYTYGAVPEIKGLEIDGVEAEGLTDEDESICEDTDGGINLFQKGSLLNNGVLHKNSVDFCQDEKYVFEYDCGWEGGIPESRHNGFGGSRRECPAEYSCSDGTCVFGSDNSSTENPIITHQTEQSENTTPEVIPNDLCSSNSACDDEDPCTSDICSGTPKQCSNSVIALGCGYNDVCLPIGTRAQGMFCSLNKQMIQQKTQNMMCENNFECGTNLCVNSKCVSPNMIQKMLQWFGRLFGGEENEIALPPEPSAITNEQP